MTHEKKHARASTVALALLTAGLLALPVASAESILGDTVGDTFDGNETDGHGCYSQFPLATFVLCIARYVVCDVVLGCD